MQLPELGDSGRLWNSLLDLSERLPAGHVVIGGVMVYLHGLTAGRVPPRVTQDVDLLFDIKLVPTSLRAAVAILTDMGYTVAAGSPTDSTHRYVGPDGQLVDILAPHLRENPKPDLTTTPPSRTVPVFGGKEALEHRVVAAYSTEHQARPTWPWRMLI
ncbi:hypothetical protein ACOBQX_16380 [Actinokineospora sp. G85]|uniref:hypothetical protein n=1 Tax=Actinokineospora sp. G85 TaxID=3406626 RepID=UPI003C70C908